MSKTDKKIVYVDMDNVLVDFPSAFSKIPKRYLITHKDNMDEVPGIFSLMDPVPGAIEAFNELADLFDTYILSTSPWGNDTAWSDKLNWVKKYIGDKATKRLILSHHKNLNFGHYLIDDRPNNGARDFIGEFISFNPLQPKGGDPKFPTWEKLMLYMREEAK
jgi:5'(3')-deoxyribonucleotidase